MNYSFFYYALTIDLFKDFEFIILLMGSSELFLLSGCSSVVSVDPGWEHE